MRVWQHYIILRFRKQRPFNLDSASARLAQSVEHQTLNLRVVGSSPTLGEAFMRYPFQYSGKIVVKCVSGINRERRKKRRWINPKINKSHPRDPKINKSPRRDLNSRPLVYKTSALTTELRRREIMERQHMTTMQAYWYIDMTMIHYLWMTCFSIHLVPRCS